MVACGLNPPSIELILTTRTLLYTTNKEPNEFLLLSADHRVKFDLFVESKMNNKQLDKGN